ncbi:MAG: hypothetical protein M1541_06510, partial [Acidobacteria bacterium]|nr:hypothetical protein [Acidobacteriota bacterium]
MLPLLLFGGSGSESWKPVAAVVAFGLTVSTLVSTRKLVADAQNRLQERLTAALHVPVSATLDQIVV